MTELIKIGDALKSFGADGTSGVATIVRIVKLDGNDKKADEVFKSLTGNQNAVWGKNLLDDPSLEGRIDPDAMYVFEQ